ncbi:MAG TPA: cupredoxin domain-containing protein [Anaerolineales bacterium]|nr:cupredoxin domain-containing protein [Anaerolineales bacterium]
MSRASLQSLARGKLLPAVLGLAGLVVVFSPSSAAPASPVDRTLRLEARSFEYSPSVLTVNRGDRVTLEVVALDVVHGVHIDGLGVEVTADPGQTARLSFVADRAGAFTIRCNVTCGPLHPFMLGRLSVAPSDTPWRVVLLAGLAVLFGARLPPPRSPVRGASAGHLAP